MMTAAAPEVIAIGETVAIGEARGVGTTPTEIELTDRNSPVAASDQSGLIVLIRWIGSNALNVRMERIALSDRTIPTVDAIERSETPPPTRSDIIQFTNIDLAQATRLVLVAT
jgi:hypothetical protein